MDPERDNREWTPIDANGRAQRSRRGEGVTAIPNAEATGERIAAAHKKEDNGLY